MSLKYYSEERGLFPQALATAVTLDQAQSLVEAFCKEYGFPPVPLSINENLRRFSKYVFKYASEHEQVFMVNPRHRKMRDTGEIQMNPKHMNLLVVLHELAHYLHCADYSKKWLESKGRRSSEIWHGPQHRLWVFRLINKTKHLWNVKPVEVKVEEPTEEKMAMVASGC
jgi:hypothetical protein